MPLKTGADLESGFRLNEDISKVVNRAAQIFNAILVVFIQDNIITICIKFRIELNCKVTLIDRHKGYF